MRIILAPSEMKNKEGTDNPFCKENFFLPELFNKREEVFKIYEEFISKLSVAELSSWFGLKKLEEIQKYKTSLRNKSTSKAIQRYTGVAFDALDYGSLSKKEKEYIDSNVILFSNLFGPIRANDLIPDYKYKQGAKLLNINIEKFYLDNFTEALDTYIGEEVIDLRAGYYEKFYKIKNAKVLSFKFIKDGKVISHWAKYYRGVLLRHLASNNITSIADFMVSEIPSLKLIEIQEKKNIKLMIMQIK